MKTLLTLFFSFFILFAHAQVPEPEMLSLKVIGGNGDDQVGTSAIKNH